MSVHATEIVARFQNGLPISEVNLGILGSNGLRNVIGVSVKAYHIKLQGNTNYPAELFLTTNVTGLFPNLSNRAGPTFECIPITLYPNLVDGNGDIVCAYSSEMVHTPQRQIRYHNSRGTIDIPNNIKVALGLYNDSTVAGTTTAPPNWICSRIFDVAGESSITFEFLMTNEGAKTSFPEKLSIGYGHTSNI